MKNKELKNSHVACFKIVITYALVSGVYIYTSDYFLRLFTSDVDILSQLQTYKGIAFILITSILLFLLVNKYLKATARHYQELIRNKQEADTQIKQSQEEYMSLFNNSPLPMWLFDMDSLKFLLVNESASKKYQFSREEFLNMSLKDIRPADDIPIMAQTLQAALHRDKAELPVVLRHKKKDGEIIYVKIEVAFVFYKGVKVRLATMADVTSEIRIQNRLLESNARLKSASEIAGLGYWNTDVHKTEIHWSEEMYKLYELDPASSREEQVVFKNKVIGNQVFEIPEEEHRSNKRDTIYESECEFKTKAGHSKWFYERQHVFRDVQDASLRIEGIVLDITKRKRYEQRIQESNDRFRMLTKATVEAIIDWDIQNNEIIWGEGFHTVHGYDLSEQRHDLWSKNIHPDDRKRVLFELSKFMLDSNKEQFTSEYRFLKANGEVAFVQHRGIFMRDANGKAIRALGAMIDLTEAVSKMRKLEWQEKALKEIAWSQSHVVRAPLANMLGVLDLIKNKVDTGVSMEVLMGYIQDSAEQLDMAIKDMVNRTKQHESKLFEVPEE